MFKKSLTHNKNTHNVEFLRKIVMPDLKIIEEAVFGVADNNDTKILVRHRCDDLEETHLYKVILQNEQIHFVLADSPKTAISQSLCK